LAQNIFKNKKRELIKECEDKNLADEKSGICQKCKNEEPLTVRDILDAPENCPLRKAFEKKVKTLIDGLSLGLQPFIKSMNSISARIGEISEETSKLLRNLSLPAIGSLRLEALPPRLTETELKLMEANKELERQLIKSRAEIKRLKAIIKELTEKKTQKYIA